MRRYNFFIFLFFFTLAQIDSPEIRASSITPDEEWRDKYEESVKLYQDGKYEKGSIAAKEALGLAIRIFGKQHSNTR